MKLDRLLGSLRIKELKSIDPELHDELLEFCSQLDYEKFPEAVKIVKGKYKTLAGLSRLYGRMQKRKKEKRMKEQLEEAERIVLSVRSLSHALEKKRLLEKKRQRRMRDAKEKLKGRGLVENISGERSKEKTSKLVEDAEKLKKDAEEKEKEGKKEEASLLYAKAAKTYREAAWYETDNLKKYSYSRSALYTLFQVKKSPLAEWFKKMDISVSAATEFMDSVFDWLEKKGEK